MNDETLTGIVGRFMRAHEAGERPDLDAYLAEAGEASDDLLAVLEAYLMRTPAPFDADAVERFAASPAAQPSFGAVLRAARQERGLLRRDVVDRLVPALGLPATARERVDQRLHEVEAGSRPAAGVSERLIDALETIIGGVASALRAARAASAAGPRAHRAGGPAFARPGGWESGEAEQTVASQAAPDDVLADEVDALFGAAD
jgi:hypothetical protein